MRGARLSRNPNQRCCQTMIIIIINERKKKINCNQRARKDAIVRGARCRRCSVAVVVVVEFVAVGIY